MQAKYRRRRQAAYREGADNFDELITQEGFVEFVTLFIAEGYKRNRNLVSISNSDPAVIAIVNRWMRDLTSRKIAYSLQYHADQDLRATREFWAQRVGVEPNDIRLQRKSNSNQLKARTWRSKHGVLAVTTNDTYFRARLRPGWIVCESAG